MLLWGIATWYFWPKTTNNPLSFTNKVSIIIVYKNEINNLSYLMQSLENQIYNKKYFEIILVNDCSDDGSDEYLAAYKKNSSLNIKLLALPNNHNDPSPKKMGIILAHSHATGQYILRTDADCVVPQLWISNFVAQFESTESQFISAPVLIQAQSSIFSIWQQIEFTSLIGIGAISIKNNMPNMCNGANLAYRKDVFELVNGYKGNEKIASGDDEFLMHKIAERFTNGVTFLKTNYATVTTIPQKNIANFVNQRVRWASKWRKYTNISTSLTAIFIVLVQIATIYLFLFDVANSWPIVTLRLCLEYILYVLMLVFFKENKSIKFIPLVLITYPFYVIAISLLTLRRNYTWKNRTFQY